METPKCRECGQEMILETGSQMWPDGPGSNVAEGWVCPNPDHEDFIPADQVVRKSRHQRRKEAALAGMPWAEYRRLEQAPAGILGEKLKVAMEKRQAR